MNQLTHQAQGAMTQLTDEELESFQKEIDRLRREIRSQLGQEDIDYIYAMARISRYFEISGRLLLHFSIDPITWSLGVFHLGLHNILDNMELGHNILHGQYDWMDDPHFHSQTCKWDSLVNEAQWRAEHNGLHHAFTNVVGKDPDLSYVAFRMTDKLQWLPYHLLQPLIISGTYLNFSLAIGLYVSGVLEPFIHKSFQTAKVSKEKGVRAQLAAFSRFANKASAQVFKNYLFFPALGGLFAPKILLGNYLASVMRNVFSASVIYCGHFTEKVQMFSEEETKDPRKGAWSLRQVLGTGNFKGGKLLSILSGHLNYQIEHHLFPRIPAWRYRELAPQVRAICEQHGVPYNTGSFSSQFKGVAKRILRHSLPDRKSAEKPVSAPVAMNAAAGIA